MKLGYYQLSEYTEGLIQNKNGNIRNILLNHTNEYNIESGEFKKKIEQCPIWNPSEVS